MIQMAKDEYIAVNEIFGNQIEPSKVLSVYDFHNPIVTCSLVVSTSPVTWVGLSSR